MPEVSIIVPVYKTEPYLRRCIDSILIQTFTNFELILVDDGSPDLCGFICDDYKYDGRVKVIHQANAGLSAARNAGIELALTSSSRYIMFVDSDDWIHSAMLESLINGIKQYRINVGVCWSQKVSEYEGEQNYDLNQCKLITPEEFFVMSPADATVAWGKVYNKQLFMDARYPVARIHEDLFLTHLLLFKEELIALIDQPLYYYFINHNGLSNTSSMKKKKDAIEGQRLRLQYFKENGFLRAFEYEYNNPSCIARELEAVDEGIVSEIEKKSALQKRLRETLKNQKISLAGHEWLYELAYPYLMKAYWLKEAVKNRVKF